MRTTYLVSIVLTLVTALPGAASAQQRWQFDLTPGVAIPTDRIGGAEPGTGIGLEGTLSVRVMPHLAIYGGWGWRNFAPCESVCGVDGVDVEETGYVFGARFEHPLGDGRAPLLMVKTGVAWAHIELENGQGRIVRDSGHGLGWDIGAGLIFDAGPDWRFTPAVRYRQLDRDIETMGQGMPARLRYVAFELSIGRRF